MNNIDTPTQDNSTQQVTPGSLDYLPQQGGGPETGNEVISSISSFNEAGSLKETQPTVETETSINYEKEPTYEKQQPQEAPQSKDAQTPPTAPLLTKTQIAKTNVVNKVQGKPNLHHITNSHDKLTNIADTEEEEFIEKVETVHEHK